MDPSADYFCFLFFIFSLLVFITIGLHLQYVSSIIHNDTSSGSLKKKKKNQEVIIWYILIKW